MTRNYAIVMIQGYSFPKQKTEPKTKRPTKKPSQNQMKRFRHTLRVFTQDDWSPCPLRPRVPQRCRRVAHDRLRGGELSSTLGEQCSTRREQSSTLPRPGRRGVEDVVRFVVVVLAGGAGRFEPEGLLQLGTSECFRVVAPLPDCNIAVLSLHLFDLAGDDVGLGGLR